MKEIIMLGIVVITGCAVGRSVDLVTTETDCGVSFMVMDAELLEQTTIAAERWATATGCNISIDVEGIPVRWATEAELRMPDGDQAEGVTNFNGFIPMFIGLKFEDSTNTANRVTHEMGHAIGCFRHTETGLLADDGGNGLINVESLTCVCENLMCETFITE